MNKEDEISVEKKILAGIIVTIFICGIILGGVVVGLLLTFIK